MPRHFLPRKSGPHRIACISLYRALLQQCARVPLPADYPSQGVINPIKHLIRKGFRRYVNCTSHKILVGVLQKGYEAEELLRTAGDGLEASLSTIHQHLWTLHNQRETARATCLPPPKRSPESIPRIWAFPGAPKVLDIRPLPKEQLSGRRAVPKLAVANGVPFLRFKKPQSPFLSRLLRDKAAQKARRWETVRECEEGGDAAEAEEEWERLVRGEVEREVEGRDVSVEREERMDAWLEGEGEVYGERWTGDVEAVKRGVQKVMKQEQVKWFEMGKRMAGVVEVERELWEKERREKRERKLDEKIERKGWVRREKKPEEDVESKGWERREQKLDEKVEKKSEAKKGGKDGPVPEGTYNLESILDKSQTFTKNDNNDNSPTAIKEGNEMWDNEDLEICFIIIFKTETSQKGA